MLYGILHIPTGNLIYLQYILIPRHYRTMLTDPENADGISGFYLADSAPPMCLTSKKVFIVPIAIEDKKLLKETINSRIFRTHICLDLYKLRCTDDIRKNHRLPKRAEFEIISLDEAKYTKTFDLSELTVPGQCND